MSTNARPGRHRSTKRHNPIVEIAGILRDAAPSSKGLVAVAAVGGLAGSLSQTAHADTALAQPARVSQAVAAPVVVGPSAGAPSSVAATRASAVASVGFVAASKSKPAPVALIDHDHEAKVKAARETAAKVAAEKKAAAANRVAEAKSAASARTTRAAASRTSTRAAISRSSSTHARTVTRGAGWGVTSAYNWASAGQCTWGAQRKWYQATGTYLGGFYGNASSWGWKAANAGWTVSSVPRSRSVVVMQPGVHGSSGAGHVGWVTSVSGNSVTIVEMNALAGPYRYNTRTLTHAGGMQYIYAP